MSVELRPRGVKCNIACQYCYQHPQRDVEEDSKGYDLELMKAAVLREENHGPFTLFGGEPLLVPQNDLEDLWAWGLEQFGGNSVQTNGSLITDAHIDLFKKYKVHVGLSIDGPGELNDVRWAGSLERTREMTRRSEESIEKLCAAGVIPSAIVTLHRGNALPDKLPRMAAWLKHLDALGVESVRLHLLEVENDLIRKSYRLEPQQNLEAMLYLAELEKELQSIRFDVFGEIDNLQRAKDDGATCVWKACDPYTTAAVRGVEGMGQRSNCGRTNKEGIDFVKAPMPSYVRYVALYHTPQGAGGCKGCRFFSMCKGHCPGTSLDGDWRNRTEHCEVYKGLFRMSEQRLQAAGETPLSLHPAREAVEQGLVAAWSAGRNESIETLVKNIARNQQATAVGSA